jgi:[ribosomal protein S5]-alanine N-acetyltransferase
MSIPSFESPAGRAEAYPSSANSENTREYPSFATRRFSFRAFALADIESLVALAGKHRVADTTIGVPQPFTAEFARMWICSHSAAWRGRHALHWAAINSADRQIAGYAGLNPIDLEGKQAQLRFWVGRGVERKRDAVEWSEAIVDFALAKLGVTRVYALQLERHPLAGRVLEAVGMEPEGLVRKRIYRGGLVEDIVCWSLAKKNS